MSEKGAAGRACVLFGWSFALLLVALFLYAVGLGVWAATWPAPYAPVGLWRLEDAGREWKIELKADGTSTSWPQDMPEARFAGTWKMVGHRVLHVRERTAGGDYVWRAFWDRSRVAWMLRWAAPQCVQGCGCDRCGDGCKCVGGGGRCGAGCRCVVGGK